MKKLGHAEADQLDLEEIAFQLERARKARAGTESVDQALDRATLRLLRIVERIEKRRNPHRS